MPSKRKRRKYRKPVYPPLTAMARHIYRACFDEPMPRGWSVEWAGFMRGALGLCLWGERRILLSIGDVRRRREGSDPIKTLVHEFIHVRFPYLRHGQEFRRLQAHAMSSLWAKAEGE